MSDYIITAQNFRREEHAALVAALAFTQWSFERAIADGTFRDDESFAPAMGAVEFRVSMESLLLKQTEHSPADRHWVENVLGRPLRPGLKLPVSAAEQERSEQIGEAIRKILEGSTTS